MPTFYIRYKDLNSRFRTETIETLDHRPCKTVADLVSCIQRQNPPMANVPWEYISIHRPLPEGREHGVGEKFPYNLPVDELFAMNFGQSTSPINFRLRIVFVFENSKKPRQRNIPDNSKDTVCAHVDMNNMESVFTDTVCNIIRFIS